MKLNLASGTNIRDGWINLDVVPRWPTAPRGCDVIWDARKDVIPFPDGSADEVYAGYLLLHLAPQHHDFVLQEIRRVLSSSGTLMVGEVDMRAVMSLYLEDPFNSRCSELIWGEQGNWINGDTSEYAEFDKHCQGFTQETLEYLLDKNGFHDFMRIKIHADEVYYELTLVCRRKSDV